LVIIRRPLLLPADRSGHMSIGGRQLGEFEKTFDNGMKSPQAPSIGSLDSVSDGRRIDELSVERECELKIRKIRIRSLNRWVRGDELQVLGPGCREKIGSGSSDVLLEIEGSVVPGERKLVSPNTCSEHLCL